MNWLIGGGVQGAEFPPDYRKCPLLPQKNARKGSPICGFL